MPCKPGTLCSSLLLQQKKKKKEKQTEVDVIEPVRRGKENGGLGKQNIPPSTSSLTATAGAEKGKKPFRRSSSQVHREFVQATARVTDGKIISSLHGLPSCEQAYSQFLASYPRFLETRTLDHLRLREYSHLEEEELACLDYCGFGLFCHAQQDDTSVEEEGFSSSFSLSEISANLWSHALFGAAPEGTMECAIRKRIMEFLNVPSSEYSVVFTTSRGAIFKLLADAYPWNTHARLVTMYDYESESVGWMEQMALESGARVYRAKFRWPSLRVCSTELKKELTTGSGKKAKSKLEKQQGPGHLSSSPRLSIASWLDRVSIQQQHKQKETKKGLFVFPVQSRVSGSKYSYQWMSLAQQNRWHVLLDASALGPKDMDSLGLSLFRPDFITASFYKLFGVDPSGFGCLLVKNSVAQSIQDSSGAPMSGMVHITPVPSDYISSSSLASEDSERFDAKNMVSAFSGPMPALDEVCIPTPSDLQEESACDDNYSSACEDAELASLGGVSRSPVFSEDGNDIPFSADAGPSPMGTASCASVSEDGFSGTLRDDSTNVFVSEDHCVSSRKDNQSSRSRIRGLCSGLLHLHTGRVGNSGDSIEADASVLKGAVKEFAEDKDKDLSFDKQLEPPSMDQIEPGKPVLNGAYVSKVEARVDSGDGEEKIPERLVLVLRKIRDEQLALGNGELSWASYFRDHERRSSVRKSGDFFCQKEEEDFVDKQGGLETIDETEIEAELSNSGEQEHSARRMAIEANASKLYAMETPELGPALCRDNVICRETEGGFRLLGCRNADTLSLGKIFAGDYGNDSFAGSIGSGRHELSSFERSSGIKSDEEQGDGGVSEPHLLCRSLDHADMMGLNKTSVRLRYLVNWLVGSLLSFRYPENNLSLVKIYGPHVRYDRGASVAFNIFDSQGRLLDPDMVRMLADRANLSLGLGFLRNLYFYGNIVESPIPGLLDGQPNKLASARVEVVTAALGLVSDFRDIYKLWSFVAAFLDPSFVARELGQLQPSTSKHGA